jgi:hypothetical protein
MSSIDYRNVLVRRNMKKDNRLLRQATYRVVRDNEFEDEDYERMTELYEMLSPERHSGWNPAFNYMCLCDAQGSASLVFVILPADWMTCLVFCPLRGHLRFRPLSVAIYRLILASTYTQC